MPDSRRMEWQRGREDELPLWRQQLATALGASRGVNARLLVVAELFLDLADTLVGRIVLATIAVGIAWLLI